MNPFVKTISNGATGFTAGLGGLMASAATNIEAWLKVVIALGSIGVIVLTAMNLYMDFREKRRKQAERTQQ